MTWKKERSTYLLKKDNISVASVTPCSNLYKVTFIEPSGSVVYFPEKLHCLNFAKWVAEQCVEREIKKLDVDDFVSDNVFFKRRKYL